MLESLVEVAAAHSTEPAERIVAPAGLRILLADFRDCVMHFGVDTLRNFLAVLLLQARNQENRQLDIAGEILQTVVGFLEGFVDLALVQQATRTVAMNAVRLQEG